MVTSTRGYLRQICEPRRVKSNSALASDSQNRVIDKLASLPSAIGGRGGFALRDPRTLPQSECSHRQPPRTAREWLPPNTQTPGTLMACTIAAELSFDYTQCCLKLIMLHRMYPKLKRMLDLLVALPAMAVSAIPILFVAVLVRLTSAGPILFWSDRVGQDNRIFRMPKFRSMRIETPLVASHLLPTPHRWLTPVGSFLRKSSLDELPQLWCIIRGDMSFVGPRPALFNQDDLIAMRTEAGVHQLVPGLTGWAQVNGRDELTISQKVQLDAEYLQRISFLFDLKILFVTFLKVLKRYKISH